MTVVLSLAAIHLLAVMSPGPDLVIAMRNSLQYGRSAGIVSALAFALASLVHLGYTVMGIALLISKSVLIFNVIKIAGALYLLFMAYKAFRANKSDYESKDIKTDLNNKSNFECFRSAFITNLLNPKVTLYFLSVFSVLFAPEVISEHLWGMVLVIFGVTFVWFSVVALALTTKKVRNKFNKFAYYLDKFFAGVLSFFAVKILLSTKS